MKSDITRREFVETLLLGGAVLTLAACSKAPPPARAAPLGPNIVVFLADDLGHECLASYGGTSYSTPRLEELARGGMRFERCFAMPMCHPSRIALLTGRYPFRTHARWGTLPESEVTFGHVLENAGYATALAGKWQMALLRNDPNHVAKAGFQTSSTWGWHEGAVYQNAVIYVDGVVRPDLAERYSPDVHTDFLIDFMAKPRGGPFLAYYPMNLPHLSAVAADDATLPRYPELVAELDRQVGRVLDALDGLGKRRDTLVLFTADNGTPSGVVSKLGEREIAGGKSQLSDAGTHVPLLASWPGVVPAGAVCPDLVDVSDFMPTLAEIAGAALPAGVELDGRSFAPQLRGRPGQPRAWVYCGWARRSFLRDDAWKLINSGELYDMTRDPDERRPIGPGQDTPESAAARAQLEAYARAYFPKGRLP